MENIFYLSYLPPSVSHCSLVLNTFRRLTHPLNGDQLFEHIEKSADKKIDLKKIFEKIKTAQLKAHQLDPNRFRFCTFWDESYPAHLRLLEYPPWVLYYQGNLPKEALTSIGIIGSRNPTAYAAEVLNSIVPKMFYSKEKNSFQIISGLAYGVDGLSHVVACKLGIPNFGVLGSGLEQLYPREHQRLAMKIIDVGGGILTEFPPEVTPAKYHFPRRNRIIAALSDLLWVVQSGLKSGTFHTVEQALTLGKTIAATPGDVFCNLSCGPHQLLRDGAQMISSAEDLDKLLESVLRPGT